MTYPSARPAAGGDEGADLGDEGYELAADPAPLPVKPIPAPVAQEVRAGSKPVKVLAYRSAGGASAPDLDTDKIVKQTLPLWLLSGGLIIEGGVAFIRARFGMVAISDAVLEMFLGTGVSTVVMMAGMLIAARVREIKLGPLPSAVLRLAALIVGTRAVSDMLMPAAMFIPAGGIVLLLGSFALYFALLGAFFELDESDTWYCVSVIFILNVALHFTMKLYL